MTKATKTPDGLWHIRLCFVSVCFACMPSLISSHIFPDNFDEFDLL